MSKVPFDDYFEKAVSNFMRDMKKAKRIAEQGPSKPAGKPKRRNAKLTPAQKNKLMQDELRRLKKVSKYRRRGDYGN